MQNNMMNLRYKNNKRIPIENEKFPGLQFKTISDLGIVAHMFSTRLGGVSTGDVSSLNFAWDRDSNCDNVVENFRRAGEWLGFNPENIIGGDQTHTANVRRVTKEDAGHGVTREKYFHNVDGLVTNEVGMLLYTSHADCVPLYFVDPVKKAIGLAHSGWRGTQAGIGLNTVKLMEKEFGSCPEDIIAAIGPSICVDCYEVSRDLYDAFEASELYKDADLSKIIFDKGNDKYQLDLWKANEYILLKAGILPEHIEITGLCTCCNKEFLFSHRGSKGKRGALGAFLGLK